MTDITTRVATRFLLGTQDFEEGVAQIKNVTRKKDTVNALLLGALVLQQRQLVSKLDNVANLVKLEGGIPSSLKKYVDDLHKDLMSHAKKNLSPADFELFKGSY